MLWLYVGLAVGALAIAMRFAWRRRSLARAAAEQLESVRLAVLEDVDLFGADCGRLTETSSTDADLARRAYESARSASGSISSPTSALAITRTLAEGQYALLRLNAVLAGQRAPERRVPCFFNPQHGPSQTDVVWTEPGWGTRTLPACAQDAARIRAGDGPLIRQVDYGGHRVPYWVAGPVFAPYGLGYFPDAPSAHRFMFTNFGSPDNSLYGDPRHRTGRSPYPLEPPH